MEKYFNIQQIAKYLKVTEVAVQRLVDGGKIPAIKTPSNVHIFKKSDIDQWLQEKRFKVKKMLEISEIL